MIFLSLETYKNWYRRFQKRFFIALLLSISNFGCSDNSDMESNYSVQTKKKNNNKEKIKKIKLPPVKDEILKKGTQIITKEKIAGADEDLDIPESDSNDNPETGETEVSSVEPIQESIYEEGEPASSEPTENLLDTEGTEEINEDELTPDTDKGECLDEPNCSHLGNDESTVCIVNKKSKLFLDTKDKCVPTVEVNMNGPQLLPHEHRHNTTIREQFDKDLRTTEKKVASHIANNISSIPGFIDTTEHGVNQGECPKAFKVKVYDIKKIKSSWWYRMQRLLRPKRHRRKIFQRVIEAYNKSAGEQEQYKQLAVVNILRSRGKGEKWFLGALKSLFTFGRIKRKNDYQYATHSANEAVPTLSPLANEEFIREHNLRNMHDFRITPENTRLDLVKAYVIKRRKNGKNCLPLTQGMEIHDKNSFFGYNYPASIPKKPSNHRIYALPITSFYLIGPIKAIPENDYKLDHFNNSRERRARDRAHKYSSKHLIFGSKDYYDFYKKPFQGLVEGECNASSLKEAEFGVYWRLTIGGKVIGAISAPPNDIFYNTQQWGAPKYNWYDPKVMFRALFRSLSKFTDKQELGWDLFK